MFLEQELRKQFVLQRIAKVELKQQQRSQETVTMLLNNILPREISHRYVIITVVCF